jgi:hypothetical protein
MHAIGENSVYLGGLYYGARGTEMSSIELSGSRGGVTSPSGMFGAVGDLSDVTNNAGLLGTQSNPIKIKIDSSRYPEAAEHAADATASGLPAKGRINRDGVDQNRDESLKGTPTKPGYDRDEFPPAVLDTGGKGASVRYITPSDNRGAGSSMGHQMRKLPNGTWVEIVVE